MPTVRDPSRHPHGERPLRGGLLGATTGACAVLAPLIAHLAAVLTSRQAVAQWRSVWVGFDVLGLAAIAATGWTIAIQKVVAPYAGVTGTLLVSDAWFDAALSRGTPGEPASVALALVLELPLAAAPWMLVPRLLPARA